MFETPASAMTRPVDANTKAPSWGHAVFEGKQEVLVDWGGVGAVACRGLFLHASTLFERIVELGVGVSHLHAVDEYLKPFDVARIVRTAFGQRRRLSGISLQERGLDQASARRASS